MKYIGIFCSARDIPEKYIISAKEVARLLTENEYGLVWGGSDTGLMHIIAQGVKDGGGRLVGISVEFLKDVVYTGADEMIVTKNLGERKALLIKRSDAILVLVGGTGTLDEATDILELKKHGHHDKPIVVLNTDNFYEGLKSQLIKMQKEGFIKQNLDSLIYFADTPDEAIEYINGMLRE